MKETLQCMHAGANARTRGVGFAIERESSLRPVPSHSKTKRNLPADDEADQPTSTGLGFVYLLAS